MAAKQNDTGAFAPLAHRDFRLLFGGMLAGSLAMPMQWVAQMWLVIELAGKDSAPLWLGVTGFARGVPLLLLSLYGGATADRMDRRRLLLLTQASSFIVALATGLLVVADLITLPVLILLALISSAAMSFDQPARQALVPDLVPRHHIASAVTLNSMAMYGAMAVGPALAGFLIGSAGVGWTYLVVAASYIAVMAAVSMMRTRSRPAAAGARRSVGEDIRLGMRYVRSEPVVLWLISITFAITGLGMAFTNLAPVLVKDVIGSDAQGLGLTMAAWGAGSVLASLALALGLRSVRGKGLLLLAASALFAAGLAGFAYSGSIALASLFQIVPGAANTVLMVLGNAAILSVTPPAMRGRVMGIYMMNRGMMPVGALAAGALGSVLGVQAAIALIAIASFVMVLAVTALQPGAWRRLDAAIASGSAQEVAPPAAAVEPEEPRAAAAARP